MLPLLVARDNQLKISQIAPPPLHHPTPNLWRTKKKSRFRPGTGISGFRSPVDSTRVPPPGPVRGFRAIPGPQPPKPNVRRRRLIAMTIRLGSASRASAPSRGAVTSASPPSPQTGRAEKRLIATVPNSKFESSLWKRTTSPNSNRNKIGLSFFAGPFRSFQPPASSFQNPLSAGDSNRHIPLLEFPATRSKQSQLTLSNRHTFGPSLFTGHSPLACPDAGRVTRHCIPNRTRQRLEIAVTHSKHKDRCNY